MKIETIFSTALFPLANKEKPYIVVVIDILRFTTAVCSAFQQGVRSVIPVSTIEEALSFFNKGYLVAGERDGKKLPFAHYGNSPFDFMDHRLKGKTMAYTTTNGTIAMNLDQGAEKILCGSFSNFSVLRNFLVESLNKQFNIVFLCSGWNGQFCLEDALFAGAMTSDLKEVQGVDIQCDATWAALYLWQAAQADMKGYIEKASHLHRLRKLARDESLEYCFQKDTTTVLPWYNPSLKLMENMVP